MTVSKDLIEPLHPGEILLEDFIEGFGVTQYKLDVSVGVPPVGSTRSSTASGRSPLTRQCG